MSSLSRSAQLILRRTALVLAFVCFWMSAIATLRHTDEFEAGATFPVAHAMLHAATPIAQDTPCLAHQWMDAWHTLHAGGLPVVLHAVVCDTLSVRPTPLPRKTHIDYASLRAPPVFVS